MNNRDIQRLLLAAGYYTGGIDGDLGPKSLTAIDTLLTRRADDCVSDPRKWPKTRRAVGAAQLVLKYAGHEPGSIDGYAGHNTIEALRSWDYAEITGTREEVDRTPLPGHTTRLTEFPSLRQCQSFYGKPGPAIEKALINVPAPYVMRIDWDLRQRAKTLRLHTKCAESAEAALKQILRSYGQDELTRLGLDRYAGAYNHRKMRGGTSWSMHAYGCAIDFYAAPNGLRVSCPKALFCGKEYQRFFDIWEDHGWTSLGRAIGRDWMHVQAASL